MTAEMRPARRSSDEPDRFAWVAVLFGGWVVGGFVLVLWALDHGQLQDVVISAYHLPLYLGVIGLALALTSLAIRARRDRRSWRRALPTGYGVIAVGAALFVLSFILDAGWREGVGFRFGIEEGLAPSRILVAISLGLIAAGPIRAALAPRAARVSPVPVALSAAFTLAAVGWPGGFHPAQNPWLATDPDLPQLRGDIWLMDASGRNQTRLIEASEDTSLGYASWSPDGDQISYTAFGIPNAGIAISEAAIWAAATDGTGARVLLDGTEWAWIPRFTPDGRSVLYTQEAPGGPWMEAGPLGPGVGAGPQGPLNIPLPNADLWSVDVGGAGDPRQLTDSAGDDRAPVPSADGTHILFDSTRDGNTEIYVIDADGTNPRRLTDDPGEDWGASWSPDGTQIAFNSSRTGPMEIFVMDADGANVRQLTFDGLTSTSPTWSPDGERIAYVLRGDDGYGEIWSIAAEGQDRRDLSRSTSTDDQVWTGGWGPDGRIVFVRTPLPAPDASPLVRLDFGAAAMLFSAILIAGIVVLLARTSPPLGSFTLCLTIASGLLAVPTEAWSVVPAGLVAGIATDLATWRSPPGSRARIAGATAAGTFVLAVGAAAQLTTGLEWTPTLLFGVAIAAGAIGWFLGWLTELGPGEAAAPA